jgi:hypothetical protein
MFTASTALLLCLAPPQGGLLGVNEGALLAQDAAAWDLAGEALALDGETAVIGVRWQDSGGSDAGAVYIHTHSGSSWTQSQKLIATDGAPADEFGYSVAIDAGTIAVGAPTVDIASQNEGAVYIFSESAGLWSTQAKLTASDLFDEDRFGSSVAISGDTLLVGAMADDDLGNYSGSVYVFTRVGGVWTERAKLLASDGSANSYFGQALALDAGTAVVGAPGPAGGAYVFVGSAATWVQQAKLTDSAPGATNRFGEALDIMGDRIAVGAPLNDINGTDSGLVAVFDRTGSSWSQTASLVAGEMFGELGRAVALGADRLSAGAPRDQQLGSSPVGALYLFDLKAGIWAQAGSLVLPSPSALDDFGASTALSGDLLIVGAPGADSVRTNGGLANGYFLVPGITSFCHGDGSGSACPCTNNSSSESGCVNSTGVGALLQVQGSPSASADLLDFSASGLLPNQPALLFAGHNPVAGGAGSSFGDGLRCAGGSVIRVGVRVPNAAGNASWSTGVLVTLAVVTGDTRRFQVWYRDPVGGPCGSAFNLTQGVEVSFTP